MILHRKQLTELDTKSQYAFVKANAALEGQHLTFSDKKAVIKVIRGKESADDLIKKLIVQNRIHR